MGVGFSYKSVRAEKARIRHSLDKLIRAVLVLATIVLGVAGVVWLVLGLAIGWVFVGFSVVPFMVWRWWRGELQFLAVKAQVATIDDVLAADILGQLPRQLSPKQLAEILGSSSNSYFFAARFGITANFLQNIASESPDAIEAVWADALELFEKTESKEISAPILATAIVRQFPGYEALLRQVHLEESDLLKGIAWYNHIQSLVRQSKQPQRTGGIARDWSFGYVPTLSRLGQNISEQLAGNMIPAIELESHTDSLEQMIETFSAKGRQNVALVGIQGVGKTSVIYAFAEKLLKADSQLASDLKYRQVYMLDASTLLAAASGRGDLERLMIRLLNEAYAAKNIILCLDNAQLFFEEGVGSVDITNTLLPVLEAGNLRIIATFDEQDFMRLSQRNPQLMNALNRISVKPATRDETLAVMQDKLLGIEYQRKVTYTYQSLDEAYRLSERYVHDLAMPGRAVKLLESAAGFSESGLVTINSVQQAIEKTMDIKVGTATNESERDTLLNMESLIHKRMINQTRAVSVVSDALRRARAGVRNQDRPIGTFLFLGPTGVGKTELAKALAEVYFNGEDRLVRIDLNEYVRADDVSRLIADASDDPMSLTAQIMKQPFSVVLLDEIEKAHPQVLTTLLQLLDEGILRDIKNRDISFRDAIIIATSNAGADRIRGYIDRGYNIEQVEQQFVNELIDSNHFRPEFLNRFDEIVTFRPLNKEELLQVIDLMIAGINKTLSAQKVSVQVDDEAKLLLVDHGYDPRLGARPMRRVVQRAVENTVAKLMLSGEAAIGSEVVISKEQVESALGIAPRE